VAVSELAAVLGLHPFVQPWEPIRKAMNPDRVSEEVSASCFPVNWWKPAQVALRQKSAQLPLG
jgi:hypothetical protein